MPRIFTEAELARITEYDLPALVAYVREVRRLLGNLLRDDPGLCAPDEWRASQEARRLLGK